VVHDFTGTLEMKERSHLAIIVDGFMKSEKLRSIVDSGRTYGSSIGASDCDPWLYPDPRELNAFADRLSSFWVCNIAAAKAHMNREISFDQALFVPTPGRDH
jgi:hypothetical protein